MIMMIDFKFEPGQKVKTDLGHQGVVEDCAVNQYGGEAYYIFTGEKDTTRWYPRSRLEKVQE
jgi:hypothetical protein